MIQSMTGYGSARHVNEGVSYSAEVRSLNNRYLKLSIKLPEHLQFLESDLDRLLRRRIARGSVTFALRVRSEEDGGARPLNTAALQGYVDQLAGVRVPDGTATTIELAALANLPGVCVVPDLEDDERRRQAATITDVAGRAIDSLIEMRKREGEALQADLFDSAAQVKKLADDVQEHAPRVVEEYHERLKARVQMLMKAGGFELAEDGLMREVAIFADRCDISEEITRLGSHLVQFRELCETGEKVGRTLDFLTQELLREANTIASKSNDKDIARCVVEIKGLIDRLKEQVQNVE